MIVMVFTASERSKTVVYRASYLDTEVPITRLILSQLNNCLGSTTEKSATFAFTSASVSKGARRWSIDLRSIRHSGTIITVYPAVCLR